ncbi:hypothetical protein GJ688_19245, partial [Heliobacillus mobilis]
ITNVNSGSTISAPAVPAKEGYTFSGWYKEASCTTPWAFTTDTVTANITLYAKWTANPPPIPINTAPTATGVSITGTAQVGQTLTGNYTYSDAENDPEGSSVYRWYRSDDSNGINKTAISGATGRTYTLGLADVGKYISFEVTPFAATGKSPGSAAESAKTQAVTAIDNLPPRITITPSTQDPTDKDVTLAVTVDGTGSNITVQKWASGDHDAAYFAGNGTVFTNNQIVIGENGTYTVYAKDEAGNEAVQVIKIDNISKSALAVTEARIDNDAPDTLVMTLNKPVKIGSKEDFQVFVDGNAGKIKSIALTGDNRITLTLDKPIRFGQNITLQYTGQSIQDKSGNKLEPFSDYAVRNNVQNTKAPEITLTVSSEKPTNQSLTVKVSVKEKGSPVVLTKWAKGEQEVAYFADGGTPLTDSTFPVDENGDYTVYVIDKAGNEAVKTITVNNIDKTALTIAKASIDNGDAKVIRVTFTEPVKSGKLGGFTVTVDGKNVSIDRVQSESKNTLLIQLSTPVKSGQAVQLSYQGGQISDEAGNLLAPVTDMNVENSVVALSLKSLSVEPGNLEPAFSPQTSEYRVKVENEVEEIKITAVPESDEANVYINGQRMKKGEPTRLPLVEGTNRFEVNVVGSQGLLTQKYTLEVERKNPELTKISITEPVKNSVLMTNKPSIAGEAAKGSVLTVYLDNKPAGKVTTGLDGKWTWAVNKALSPGEHEIQVIGRNSDGENIESEAVTFTVNTSKQITMTMDPPSLVGDGRSTATVTVTVKSAKGKPVPNIPVAFSTNVGKLDQNTIVTDDRGQAVIELTAPLLEGITPAQGILRANIDDDGQRLEAVLTMQFMPASIEGIVKDQTSGEIVAGATVVIKEDFNGDGVIDFTASTETGSDGRYKIYVPRGNWTYHPIITFPMTVNGQQVNVTLKQKAPVGQLNGVGEEIKSSKNLTGMLLVADPNGEAKPVEDVLGGQNVTVTVRNASGQAIHTATAGQFEVDDIPPGEYQVIYKVKGPDGEELAGRTATVTVQEDGEISVNVSLIDPYGIIRDQKTNKPLQDVKVTLHWANTELNQEKGRKPDGVVDLPTLEQFPPNQNKDPQKSTAKGEYAWMVFPQADYYIIGEKEGYEKYDSRVEKRDVSAKPGEDSWIEDGIIHVGETIVNYDFKMKPKKTATQESGGSSGGDSDGDGGTMPIKPNPGNTPSPSNPTMLNHTHYVNGYPDGTFRPEQPIRRSEMAALLANALSLPGPTNSEANYPDVDNSFWARQAIAEASRAGLMEGYPDQGFHPEANVTRAQMAAIIAKWKSIQNTGTNAFDDTRNHWAEKYIAGVNEAGWMKGYADQTFRPEQPITRAEAVTALNRLFGRGPLTGLTKATWSDVPSTYWAWGQIEEASIDHSSVALPGAGEQWIK